MLMSCPPPMVSPLGRGNDFDELEFILDGCLRASGNNDVEGDESDEDRSAGSDCSDSCGWTESDTELLETASRERLMATRQRRTTSSEPSADATPSLVLHRLEPQASSVRHQGKPQQGASVRIAMTFANLKNSLFRKKPDRVHFEASVSRTSLCPRPARARSETTTQAGEARTIEPWNSTCERFTCLKYYIWTGGAMQFEVSFDPMARELVVHAVLAPSSICCGDVLEAVADVDVRGMDVDAVVELLMRTDPPTVLRFRSQSEAKRQRLNVVLRDKKLGVTFMSDGPHCVPVVTLVARSALGIRAGDVLVGVNGMDTVTMGLENVLTFVKSSPRPLRFTFARVTQVNPSDNQVVTRAHSLTRTCPPEDVPSSPWQVGATCDMDVHIVWVKGPLGVAIVEDSLSGLPTVSRLTGKGTSHGLERLGHGFILHTVNGAKVASKSLSELRHELETLRKPVLLEFRPPLPVESFCGDDRSSRSGSFAFSSPSSSVHSLDDSDDVAPTHTSLNDSQPPSVGCDDWYHVTWNSPRLGLGLALPLAPPEQRQEIDENDGEPTVREVKPECTLIFPGNPIGDLLAEVDGRSTAGLDVRGLRELLESTTKPAILSFRRGQERSTIGLSSRSWGDDTDDEDATTRPGSSSYSLLWADRSALGLTFASYLNADSNDAVVIYIKQVVPSGQAARTRLVTTGDVLLTVNGKVLPAHEDFHTTMEWLASVKRPLVLGFRRTLVERDSGRNRRDE